MNQLTLDGHYLLWRKVSFKIEKNRKWINGSQYPRICLHWAFCVLKVAKLANKLWWILIWFFYDESQDKAFVQDKTLFTQCYVQSYKFNHCSFLFLKSWSKVAAACKMRQVKCTQIVAVVPKWLQKLTNAPKWLQRLTIRVFITSLFHSAKNRTQWNRRAKWYETKISPMLSLLKSVLRHVCEIFTAVASESLATRICLGLGL